MNCFLFMFMITLTVATINPDDDLSYGEVVKKYNSLTKENEKCKDRITRMENKIQMIYMVIVTDEVRVTHCGLINSIKDERITASSINQPYYGTRHSRLNSRSGYAGWVPQYPFKGSWIQLNLSKDKVISAVATQGDWQHSNWIKTFSVSYKSSSSSIFSDVKNQYGGKKIFNGNTDPKTVVINDFTPPLTAQFIRIHPLTWYPVPVLRFDVLSC